VLLCPSHCPKAFVLLHFWLASLYPVRQSSLHLSVSYPSFQGLQALTLPSALSLVPLLVFPQVIPPFPPLLAFSHVLFPPCAISHLLSQPAQLICFSHPPGLVSQLLSTFCIHCQVSWWTWAVLGPQTPNAFPPLLDLLSFPKLLVLLWSPPALCISINFLPPADTTHR